VTVAPRYKILVIDDHPLVRHGLRALLKAKEKPHTFYEAADPIEALPLIKKTEPNIVILDVSFPNANGIEAVPKIRAISPKTEILIFTVHTSSELAQLALRAGARAFVTKLDQTEEFLAGLKAVKNKRTFLSRNVEKEVAKKMPSKDANEATGAANTKMQLSKREIEIVTLLTGGQTSREIANRLRISVREVSAHRSRIMRKMNFESLADLIRFGVRQKWVRP
jgi:DNA-binding NarL/FixJ family response regulator